MNAGAQMLLANMLADPPESTFAGMITASATVFTALGGLILAISVLIPILRSTKDTNRKVDAVHVLVNQQHTDLLRYQRALVSALAAANVTVPLDQSLGPNESD